MNKAVIVRPWCCCRRATTPMRGMMVCCPMTSSIKGYVFEVVVTRSPPGVVLADQIKNLDWRARGAVHKSTVSATVLAEVQARIKALLRL